MTGNKLKLQRLKRKGYLYERCNMDCPRHSRDHSFRVAAVGVYTLVLMIQFTLKKSQVVRQLTCLLKDEKLPSTRPFLIHSLRCERETLYAKQDGNLLWIADTPTFDPVPYDEAAVSQWGRVKVIRKSKRMKERTCIECQCSLNEINQLFCERTEHTIHGYINHEVYRFCLECGLDHALTYPTTYQYA